MPLLWDTIIAGLVKRGLCPICVLQLALDDTGLETGLMGGPASRRLRCGGS